MPKFAFIVFLVPLVWEALCSALGSHVGMYLTQKMLLKGEYREERIFLL